MSGPDPTHAPLERLSPADQARLRQVAAAADGAAWLVGGAVRDLLLGLPVHDIDVVVETPADEVARRLPVTIELRSQFGTLIIVWPEGDCWDLVTARAERYPAPAALPVVWRGSLAEDLARRDFSVNALAAALDPADWGRLVDPLGGLADLRAGRLRILHPRSYHDDPTRLYRLWRYAVRLGFTPEPQPELRRDPELQEALAAVSGERVMTEWRKSLEAADWWPQARALSRHGLAAALAGRGLLSARGARWQAAAEAVWGAAGLAWPEELWLVRLLAVLPGGRRWAAGWPLEREAAAVVATPLPPVAWGERQASRRAAAWDRLRDGQLLRVAAARPSLTRAVVTYRREHRDLRPALDGHALLALGCPRGPVLGRLLARLRGARIDGLVSDEAGERALVAAWRARDEVQPDD